ncbi:hypothetical protein GF322_02100 [Candidatus Dependentiae bacterium]|nr:hypothetical protein [Candidatus Dependentiae bacterium]
MLQLKAISDTVNIYVKSDPYIPIDIDFGFWDPSIDPTLYWRTGDLKKTLIEIGIGKKRGEIRSITLVLFPKYKIGITEKILNNKIEENGLPLLETKKWDADTHLDEVGNFDIYLGKNNITITFASNEVESQIINDRIVFYFDKNKQLCSIEIKDFSLAEINNLKEYLS